VLVALLAVVLVFVILRMIVYFVSSIPKWIYVLLMIAVFCGVIFIFYGTSLLRAFGL